MFRPFSGFKAHYEDLTLLIVSSFDEWQVLIYGPGVTIHGKRQLGVDKAKEHAAAITASFLRDVRNQEVPAMPELEWASTDPNDWLAWRE